MTVTYTGREIAHVDEGEKRIQEAIEALADIARVDAMPKRAGRKMICVLSPLSILPKTSDKSKPVAPPESPSSAPSGPRPTGDFRPSGPRPPRPNGPRPGGPRPGGSRPNGPRPGGSRPGGSKPSSPRPHN